MSRYRVRRPIDVHRVLTKLVVRKKVPLSIASLPEAWEEVGRTARMLLEDWESGRDPAAHARQLMRTMDRLDQLRELADEECAYLRTLVRSLPVRAQWRVESIHLPQSET